MFLKINYLKMRKLMLPILLLSCSTFFAQNIELLKNESIKNIDYQYDNYKNIALQIWDYAEVGYKENKSSELLQKTLKANGFNVSAGVADIPTAFVATFGEGKPVIGILAEFDALPGLAQAAEPMKSPIQGKNAGHGCGHHLFGTASVAAGIELRNTMMRNKMKGTIKVYGTPAEEGGGGKVYMVRAGLFNDVDIVMHWHPGDGNSANPSSSLANMSAKFKFRGISAHAAGAPDKGRSALDGVEAMNNMVNMMREHIPQESRIHYVITEGGKAPNVVPDFAEVYYYCRHPRRDVVKDLFERIVKCANGAAIGTDTKVEYEIIGGVFDVLPVKSLAKVMHNNLTKVGGVTYNAEEIAFGQKLQETFIGKDKTDIKRAASIDPYVDESYRSGGGSTDVGDVSWAVPTVGLRTATWIPGTPAHSWQAVACGGKDIGAKGMMVAAKTITLMGLDLLTDKQIIEKATAEWNQAKGTDFKYFPLLGDRKPALNYRDGASDSN
jgi:aminobenzoyl-glutamate utilization protein B